MIKLAIDLGSSATKIFKIGSGIVLAEPSCVAVDSGTVNVKAIGEEAKRLIGKTAEYTTIIFPVFEADIVDEGMAAAMLSYFLNKVGVTPRQARRAEVLFSVPCGAQDILLDKYYRLAESCGIGSVHFVEAPFLSALGQNMMLSETNPVFVVDIGGGSTNIAAFSLDGIIAGIGLNIGGGNIDSHIIDCVAEKFNLKIGLQTSEKLKMTVGSLYKSDNETYIVNGRDITTGRPRSVAVSSPDIYECMQIFADKVIEYTSMVLAKLPAEVSASVWRGGIFLSGGGSMLIGLDDYMSRALQMDVTVADEPQMAVILGAGRTVGNEDILETVRVDY
mgnify:CR=1 FL=1